MVPCLQSIEQQSTTVVVREEDRSQKSCFQQQDGPMESLQYPSYDERWSEENIQSIIHRWKLSSAEEGQLRELKMRVADIDNWKNNPMELVRYLRGPKKFEQIEGIFRAMIQWRKEKRADHMLEEFRPNRTLLYYIPSAILKGCDKDGDPIYLERGGVLDGVGLQRFGIDSVLQHIIWLREQATRGDWLEDYERTKGRAPAQVTIIFDMEGMSSRHLKSGVIPMFKEIVKINQERYCGMAKRIILLRAPGIFQLVWSVAKHFFPPEGRKLMVFTGPNDYLTTLDKYVDREVLPPCICKEGKGSAVDCMPQNFEGGIIPVDAEKSIPDEEWIARMLSPKAGKTKTEEKPMERETHQKRVKPVCLADYEDVRILADPASPHWHEELETVLVVS